MVKLNSLNQWIRNHSTNILRVAIVALFLLLAVWAITLNHRELVIADHEPWLWLTVALVSVGPELAGIVIGVVTIDYLNERRQTEQLKAQLIRQMGMNIRDVAVPAARELGHHGWLYDGSLNRADLANADLGGASLRGADLSGAFLNSANLSGAYLWGADLSGAHLLKANLSGAYLLEANLSGAFLNSADLSEALLWGANLSRAILTSANLSGAYLGNANLSGVYLVSANLSGTHLWRANLSGTYGLTIEQLDQARTRDGAIMPDGVQLGQKETEFASKIDGPSFDEWKTRYLAEQQAQKEDTRPGDGGDERAGLGGA